MKKSSQRLFMMEMVLCILILFVSLSVTNLIFVRSMTQHQKNEAMIKMLETLVLISEDFQSQNLKVDNNSDLSIYFDSKGNKVENESEYKLEIIREQNENNYRVYKLTLLNSKYEKLLSWDVIKVVE